MVKPVQHRGRLVLGDAVLLHRPAQPLLAVGVDEHVEHMGLLPQHPAGAAPHNDAGALLGQPLDDAGLQQIQLVGFGNLGQLALDSLGHGHQRIQQRVGVRLLQVLDILRGGAPFPGGDFQNLPAVHRDAQGLPHKLAHQGAAAGVLPLDGDDAIAFHIPYPLLSWPGPGPRPQTGCCTIPRRSRPFPSAPRGCPAPQCRRPSCTG